MQMKNNEQQKWRVLAPGKVYFHHGPASIVVIADKNGEPLTDLCCQAYAVIDSCLSELAQALPLLRFYPSGDLSDMPEGLPRRMMQAVLDIGEPTLTPMATVAGAISDTVADWIFAQGADRVIVNNGGDIAIRLAHGKSVKMGIVSSIAHGSIDRSVMIRAEDGIGGVATSGFGGRSMTRGVAQAVSAFASNCTLADALATHLANCSYVNAPQVETAKAGSVDSTSDIKDLDIVIKIGMLDRKDVKQAISQVKREVMKQFKNKNLIAACACVQNNKYSFGVPSSD